MKQRQNRKFAVYNLGISGSISNCRHSTVYTINNSTTILLYQIVNHLTHLSIYYGRSYHFFIMFKLIMYLPQKNKLCTVFTFTFLAPSPNLSKANGQSLMFSLLTFPKCPLTPDISKPTKISYSMDRDKRVLVVELHIL